MSQTAEEQILAAAQHSIQDKLRRFDALEPELKSALAVELSQGDLGLQALSQVLAEDDILHWLAGQAPQALERLHESIAARFVALFPATESTLIPSVQSLSLVDFDAEDEEAEEGFSLIDFDGPNDSEADAAVPVAALREPLWLLMQLTAAWYYVHGLKH